MRAVAALVGIAVAGAASPARAADEPEAPPDVELLEYLGSFEAQDEEWIIAAEWETDEPVEPDGKSEPEAREREDAR